MISLLQGPASVSGQIRKVLPAGTLRMTLSAAAHAAAQAPVKAWRKKQQRQIRLVDATALQQPIASWHR